MSDTMVEGSEAPDDENPNFKALREADKAKAKELAEAKREIAVLKSGIDAESKLGQLFLKSYDGENTPEAIKAAAEEYGIPLAGTEVKPEPEVPLEPNGTEERQALADNAPADTGVSKDPNEIALENYQASIKAGARESTAMGDFVATLSHAAHEGDPRVMVPDTAQ